MCRWSRPSVVFQCNRLSPSALRCHFNVMMWSVGWNPKTRSFARTFCSFNHITLTNYLLAEAFMASSFT